MTPVTIFGLISMIANYYTSVLSYNALRKKAKYVPIH